MVLLVMVTRYATLSPLYHEAVNCFERYQEAQLTVLGKLSCSAPQPEYRRARDPAGYSVTADCGNM